jgi:hypothetical protein
MESSISSGTLYFLFENAFSMLFLSNPFLLTIDFLERVALMTVDCLTEIDELRLDIRSIELLKGFALFLVSNKLDSVYV